MTDQILFTCMYPWVAQICASFAYLYSIYFLHKVSKAAVMLKRMENRSKDLPGAFLRELMDVFMRFLVF